MAVKFKATPIRAGDLKPGDLFSIVGPTYWDNVDKSNSIGEKAYIRSNTPASAAIDSPDTMVYQISIVQTCTTCHEEIPADWPHHQCIDCQSEYSFEPEPPDHQISPHEGTA